MISQKEVYFFLLKFENPLFSLRKVNMAEKIVEMQDWQMEGGSSTNRRGGKKDAG